MNKGFPTNLTEKQWQILQKKSGTDDKKEKIFTQGHHGLHPIHQQD
jgi:hypothetical protein